MDGKTPLGAGLLGARSRVRGGRRGRRDAAEKPSRTVLMILFHFAPLGGVPTPRNVRNVQYLPRFGSKPVVITSWDVDGSMDPEALALIPPGTLVLRARCLQPHHARRLVDPLRDLRVPTRAARALEGAKGSDAGGTGLMKPAAGVTAPADRPAPTWLWRLHRLLAFPDGQVGWLPFAVLAAVRAHRATPFDAVYSTSAPFTAHLVAGVVKRITGVPWVAEFRDPWLGNPVSEAVLGPRPWLHRRLQVKVERWILRSADRIVFVSPSTARLYRKRYPDAAEIVTITNGHDQSETVARNAKERADKRYRIVWTGSLHRPGELEMFLEAVEDLAARQPAVADRLEVLFYGDVSDSCRVVADRFKHGPLGRVLHFQGFVSRQMALEALAGADTGLLMLGPGPGMGQFVPAKLFDILGQNQQVLAVLPPGDARNILEELDWGVIAEPNVASIERAIERMLTLPPPDRLADPEGTYARETLVRRLADTLGAAAAAARRRNMMEVGRPTPGEAP